MTSSSNSLTAKETFQRLSRPALYAITEQEERRLSLVEQVRLLAAARVPIIQLRKDLKQIPPSRKGRYLDEEIPAMREACHESGSLFIVNNYAELAKISGADGLHLGQDDDSPSRARKIIGDDALLGLSTHNQEQLERGLNEPVDYLAIGPIFPTGSKKNPDPVVGLDGVALAWEISNAAGKPLVAIGGITPENARKILECAPGIILAVISSIAGHGQEIPSRVNLFQKTFQGRKDDQQ